MEQKRKEIIDYAIKTKLVETCVQYRLNKCTNKDWVLDMVQEVYLWLCEYDIEKLNNAYINNHLSALITRFIINQFFSKNSPFYKNFKKSELLSDEISPKELQIPDPDYE